MIKAEINIKVTSDFIEHGVEAHDSVVVQLPLDITDENDSADFVEAVSNTVNVTTLVEKQLEKLMKAWNDWDKYNKEKEPEGDQEKVEKDQ